MRIVIDGMNVIGSRPDGWWHDRPAARRALVRELSSDHRCGEDELTVVFDGTPEESEVDEAAASGITVVFAPGGPDAADDAIVEMLGKFLGGPGPDMTVVTSDGALADRVRSLGARVEGAASFRSSLGRRGGRSDA